MLRLWTVNFMQKFIIDLHIHSTCSDGTCSAQEIIDLLHERHINLLHEQYANRFNLSHEQHANRFSLADHDNLFSNADHDNILFSFTDHDSVGCYQDIDSGKAKLYDNMFLLPGVELSCRYNDQLRDILGYGISIAAMQYALDAKYSKDHNIQKQQSILQQLKSACSSLRLKFDPSLQATGGHKGEGYTLMFNELNKYPLNLQKYPFINNNSQFYWRYVMNPQSPFFVDATYDLPTLSQAVKLIHCAGGKAFLAHPFAYGMDDNAVRKLVKDAVSAGVDGIEIQHASHTPEQVREARAFAKKYRLLSCGGSDFHGDVTPGLELISGYGNVKMDIKDIQAWIFEEKMWPENIQLPQSEKMANIL